MSRSGGCLEGQALQDVWTGDARDGRGERQVGTSVRFFDPNTQQWTVVWILPESAVVVTVSGGEVDGRIVLEGDSEAGSRRGGRTISTRARSRGAESVLPMAAAPWTLLADYRMTRRT